MKIDGADATEDSDDEDWERVVPGTQMEVTGAQPAVGEKVGEWFTSRIQRLADLMYVINENGHHFS